MSPQLSIRPGPVPLSAESSEGTVFFARGRCRLTSDVRLAAQQCLMYFVRAATAKNMKRYPPCLTVPASRWNSRDGTFARVQRCAGHLDPDGQWADIDEAAV